MLSTSTETWLGLEILISTKNTYGEFQVKYIKGKCF